MASSSSSSSLSLTSSSKLLASRSGNSNSRSSSSSRNSISSYEALSALCFSPGNGNRCVFFPVSGLQHLPSAEEINDSVTNDMHRILAQQIFTQEIRKYSVHKRVGLEFRLGANALISDIKRIAHAILEMPGLCKMARTHWIQLSEATEKEGEEEENHFNHSRHQHLARHHRKLCSHPRNDQDIKEGTATIPHWLCGGGCWHCAMYNSGMDKYQGGGSGGGFEDHNYETNHRKPKLRNLTRSML
eukprot:CAMPEP_0185260190 /NCGR_PEP_ID=MMETSP1359-20130426/8821_1 /TAXON_ID=552665 /ORGANISM="Bigelowiella longifila, Strain CCMP242" /LENGTH=243 /DNA_ID=CAMNT_0027846353 /DNA_START=631 /DNA_END=1362 /DNA_ORIENTATION=+